MTRLTLAVILVRVAMTTRGTSQMTTRSVDLVGIVVGSSAGDNPNAV
jgi:hypothetical protein